MLCGAFELGGGRYTLPHECRLHLIWTKGLPGWLPTICGASKPRGLPSTTATLHLVHPQNSQTCLRPLFTTFYLLSLACDDPVLGP